MDNTNHQQHNMDDQQQYMGDQQNLEQQNTEQQNMNQEILFDLNVNTEDYNTQGGIPNGYEANL